MKAISQIIIIVFIYFIPTISISQNNLENDLLKAYSSKDSSTYLFNKIYKKLTTKIDTANYLYYKLFKKDYLKEYDSVKAYSKELIPLLKNVNLLEKLRKVYVRLYYIYLRNGNYDRSLKEIQKALETAKTLKDTAFISLHNSDISILYHDFNFFDKGIIYGKKAFNIMNKASKKKYRYLIIANNAIGINFDDWNKPDSALYYHYKNLKYLKKVKDTLKYSYVYNNIANTNLKIKNYSKAQKYLKKSLAINKINNRDYNLASNYTNLATISYKQNKFNEATNYFTKANFYAKRSKSIEKIRDVFKQESEFYKKIKNYKKALEKQDEFYKLKDSVFNDERSLEFSKLEVEYETAKKEKEISQQKEELLEKELAIKNRNLYATFLSAALLLLGVISFGYYRRNLFKRKQLQKEIELKDALSTIKTQNRLQEQRLRISRDLHDNIGSQLTFIISSIDNLKFVSKDANEKLKNKLSNISTFTSDTIFQLRDTIWAMNKNNISIDDIHTRTLSFIEKAKTAKPEIEFTTKFEIDNTKTLTSIQGMNIFRVIQEAINNAVKYAEASKISIQASETENQIQFKISDNGKGFNLSKVSLGNGLSNMEKRMSEINGEVFINSKPSQGTDIQIICNL